jgi:hypothetical protein
VDPEIHPNVVKWLEKNKNRIIKVKGDASWRNKLVVIILQLIESLKKQGELVRRDTCSEGNIFSSAITKGPVEFQFRAGPQGHVARDADTSPGAA